MIQAIGIRGFLPRVPVKSLRFSLSRETYWTQMRLQLVSDAQIPIACSRLTFFGLKGLIAGALRTQQLGNHTA